MLQTKKPESPLDKLEFKDDAYDTNGRFSIYIPKQKNYLLDLLKNHTTPKLRGQSEGVESTPQIESKTRSKLRKEVEEARQNAVDNANPQSNTHLAATVDPESQAKFDEWQRANQQASTKIPHSILKNSSTFNQPNMPENTFQQNITVRPYTSQGFGESMSQVSARRSLKSSATKRSAVSKQSSVRTFRETLFFDTRTQSIPKSSITNRVIEDLVRNEQTISRNPALMESLTKLRDMNLLKERVPQLRTYKGVGKFAFVYNDYHSRNTNPGYSRNAIGIPFNH
mmetsp:Transcript_58622/g.67712  ORF Transcript_58622/g.67712 Transcript_58622/m.67712 type:complete len:283 (+) Transcript_58622:28-876(+)